MTDKIIKRYLLLPLSSTASNATFTVGDRRYSPFLVNPEHISYDWLKRRLYWADTVKRGIFATQLDDGSNTHRVVDAQRPRSLAVDPCRGVVYYSDWVRPSGVIKRATLNGLNLKTLVDSKVVQPSGLTIDFEDESRLYFADAIVEKIFRCSDAECTQIEAVVDAAIYPHSMTVIQDRLFWTDVSLRGLFQADKSTGAGLEVCW